MNIIKIILLSIFLPTIAFADANCFIENKDEPWYDLFCGKKEENDKLEGLRIKVRDNAEFILKWRLDVYDAPKARIDLENFDRLESKGVALIHDLALMHCDLELGIGGSIGTGSQGTNHSYCMRDIMLDHEESFYKRLDDYTYVIKPSFNCEKASTKVEKTICGRHNLSSRDKRISKYYAKLVEKGVDVKQKEWLKSKRNACEKSSDIYECLSTIMTERSEYLYGLTKS
jgi:uncharacterized protein YecT (DUF1311 family)